MARPFKCRRVGFEPSVEYFKPRGIPVSSLEQVELSVDELEAIRLSDLDGLYQEQAAVRMKVSRQTFGNIVNSAHAKIADALVNGKAIRIKGGNYQMDQMKQFMCSECSHKWELAYGTGRPAKCPQCGSGNIHRCEADRGRRVGRGRGRCRRVNT